MGQTLKHPPQAATKYVFVLFLVIRFSPVVETLLFVVVGVANIQKVYKYDVLNLLKKSQTDRRLALQPTTTLQQAKI